MAGLMFACLSALNEAGLSAIAERMFALVRDPSQKVPHRLAGVRVIINVEKHRFARFKQGVQHLCSSPAVDAGIMPALKAQQSSEAGRSTLGQAAFEDVFTRERASELLAILDALTRQTDLEPTYLLRASTLAVAIHRLALQEQTWLDQQSTDAKAGAKGHSKRAGNVPTRTSPNRSPPSSEATGRQANSRTAHEPRAYDPAMTSTLSLPDLRRLHPFDSVEPEPAIAQREFGQFDGDQQSAPDQPRSPVMMKDRSGYECHDQPPWDNDQSFVTINPSDVEPEFSHQELVPSLRLEPPDD